MTDWDAYLDTVANGTRKELNFFLSFFLHECPTSMIPAKQQVQEWAEVLEKRGPQFLADAAACHEFSKGSDG
ncbi:hypothetical protein [Paraburkholderia graminis]|uniref:hypothetical protein n=1 Tax=Paraburkholderia graminis TaxID=60548 RepID=UPI0004248462